MPACFFAPPSLGATVAGKAVVAAPAGESADHLLRPGTWVAVSTPRSFVWVEVAGVLVVAALVEREDGLLRSPP